MIHDYKFGTWSIECEEKNENTVQLAKEIRGKIRKASNIIDEEVYKEVFRPKLEANQFYINNTYLKLKAIYEFYKSKVKESITRYEKEPKVEKKEEKEVKFEIFGEELTSNSTTYINTGLKNEREISNYSFGLMNSFYSLLEHLLSIFINLQNPDEHYIHYKERLGGWKSEFKDIFELGGGDEISEIYDSICDIKETYRNPLNHGLLGEENFLVELGTSGRLVPLSYQNLDKIHFRLREIRRDDAEELIRAFDSFLSYIEQHQPYSSYLDYLDYGFPVPVSEFEGYLEGRACWEEARVNRDI